MNNSEHTHKRPLNVWAAVAVLSALSFLSAVGGFIFNLSGAEDASDIAVGVVFVALALAYLVTAVRLPSGRELYRIAAIALASAHGLFNLTVKVGIEGETSSVMFVVLALMLIALLAAPRTRRFFGASRLAEASA